MRTSSKLALGCCWLCLTARAALAGSPATPAEAHQVPRSPHNTLSDAAATTSGGAPAPAPAYIDLLWAAQLVYTDGVPHTDRNGRRRMEYDPAASFLPLVLYDAAPVCNGTAMLSGSHGDDRGNGGGGERGGCLPHGTNASVYTAAGFNTVLPYPAFTLTETMAGFAVAGLQVIRESPSIPAEVVAFRNHPNMLAWYLEEEPTGRYWNHNMSAHYEAYLRNYAAVKALDPVHPVFVLDCPWITPPATEWWVKWNSYGDVSAHDNYPLSFQSQSLATINGNGGGIPQTVGLAVAANNQSKPVWLCLQSFESGDWQMPSARELRGMAYTGLVHGATGIIYFAMDSMVTRAGGVVGMAPGSLANVTWDDRSPADERTRASTALVSMGVALWEGAAALNRELEELQPILFSPTSRLEYSVFMAAGTANATETPLRAMRKTCADGRDVLMVVNVDKARIAARVLVHLRDGSSGANGGKGGEGGGTVAPAPAEVLFENRTVPLTAAMPGQPPALWLLDDTFEEMDVHVYSLPASPTTGM